MSDLDPATLARIELIRAEAPKKASLGLSSALYMDVEWLLALVDEQGRIISDQRHAVRKAISTTKVASELVAESRALLGRGV